MTIDFKNLNTNKLQPKTAFEEKVLFFLKEWFSEASTVSVQTSGSTGIPKIFDIEKEKMQNSAKMTCDFLGLNEGDTALLCLPVEYISGKMMLVRSLERKLKLIVKTPDTHPLKDLEEKVDFCAMTPLQVENSLSKIHLIKNLIIGGAAVSETLKKKLSGIGNEKNDNRRIFETYGMSETLSHIALKEIFPNEEEYFTTFEGIEISKDERDCLKIHAPMLNPDVLTTNDLVELKNEKQFKFLGRADNIINSGGAKIFPEELETLVKKHIENEVVFLGIPDEILGHKLVLAIEGERNEELENRILNIQYRKAFYKPKEVFFLDEIPRTPNGKVDRRTLLQLLTKS